MSLKDKPLLVLNGVDLKPLHGQYAKVSGNSDNYASIYKGLQRPVIITFDDANRHLITLGATGSRKSTSIQGPATVGLIESGCPGMIIDVKRECRHLADKYPDQVIVIGADDDAEPYNLIEGMSDAQFSAFLDDIRPKSREPYWGSLGLQDAQFIRRTYRVMGQEPTLAQIADALSAPKKFVSEFDPFMRWAESLPADYLQLLNAVLSNAFSVLGMGRSELLGIDPPGIEEIQRQYTWQTAGLISALVPFSADANLRNKFSPKPVSEPDDEQDQIRGFCMEDLLYRDRKVLLLDLPVDSFGKSAHIISKLLRIRMIATITGFQGHKEIGCGDTFYTFFAADEYQHLINIDQDSAAGGLYDDTTFFDRCRGYGHINLVATQSVSALSAKVPSTQRGEALDCLLQNIGTVIAFSSSDSQTDQLLRGRVAEADGTHISSVVRSDLSAGQAFVIGRNLRCHNNATLVARIQASVVAGVPYMSRYFEGMPAPAKQPVFSSQHELFVNPYRKQEATPPASGTVAMKRSFRQNRDELLIALETAQGLEKVCDGLLMEDARYRVSLKGELIGEHASIWQPGLFLVVSSQGSDEWRFSLPLTLVMPRVVNFMPVWGKHRSWKSVTEDDEGETINQTRSSQEMEIVVLDDAEYSGDHSLVEFRTESAVFRLPFNYWKEICRALGRLEGEYREVCLKASVEKDDPFDAFDVFDDYSEGD
ncbi:type IV secretory system conjugative DNA transfer family protein [Marinobacter orientalis]|uniref:Uncharacterized protein n=1 Tax=Marinobacter orientalis TaxID=1928859 RepID=A0A7Y0RC19_9GAMM|nr:hypothetical protein [Marinobacter orientalis]NMT63471.1 hypothetical protein [Marinobacter orientalis]TGX48532.1 hypothetical protein DIT72_14155 [Marinobacter orientalis]